MNTYNHEDGLRILFETYEKEVGKNSNLSQVKFVKNWLKNNRIQRLDSRYKEGIGFKRPDELIEYYTFNALRVKLMRHFKNKTTVTEQETIKTEGDDKRVMYEINTTKRVLTNLEDAIELAQIDLEEWEVDKWLFNSWMVTMKGNDGQPISRTNYQVKLWVKRRVYNGIQWAEDLYEKVKGLAAMPAPPLGKAKKKSGLIMAEIDLFDPHFGKYALKQETNDPYDIFIAKERYQTAICDLVAKSEPYGVNEYLYVLGNDHFHFDNWDNTTTKGTPQDTHLRWWEVWTNGCDVAIQNIRMLRQHRPVKVVMVLSNHDWQNVFKLGYLLHQLFDGDKYVDIDYRPISRKYVEHGVNLIGFTHGNEEKHKDLPMLMLRENQKTIADKKFMEFHLGHFHKEKRMDYKSSDEEMGVVVRYLRSLSSADFWHFKNGYVNNIKGGEAFIWSDTDGLVANLRTNL